METIYAARGALRGTLLLPPKEEEIKSVLKEGVFFARTQAHTRAYTPACAHAIFFFSFFKCFFIPSSFLFRALLRHYDAACPMPMSTPAARQKFLRFSPWRAVRAFRNMSRMP